MADYKETTVNGTAWQRAQMIIISNHLGQVPTVTYQEEAILAFDNGNIQFVDLTGATGFLTIQFAHPQPGANYQIFIKQPATALDPINWPAAVKWPQGQKLIPTAELNAVDAVSLYYDGTGAVYYGDWQLNFS